MKFVVAMMKHETNTFSPVPTPLERFGPTGPYFGDDAVQAYAGGNQGIAAYYDLARAERAEMVVPIAATALPSGVMTAETYDHMSGLITAAVARGCDGVLLDLHGAMVAANTDDGEGELLARIRAIAPDIPIAVCLDLHTNLTGRMVDNCTAMVGYKTYPHVDKYATGEHVGRIVLAAMKGEANPVMAWGNRPMLPHTLKMGTDDGPMKDLVDMARAAEGGPILAATAFGGFPISDLAEAGLSAVVVADGDAGAAEEVRERLLDAGWERRHAFVHEPTPLADAIACAKALDEGPVLLIDHADNAASGGTQDSMATVAEAMCQGLEDVAVAVIVDPEAVARMIGAGVGAEVTLPLGGKIDLPRIGQTGAPLEVSGTIRTLSDGVYTITGPMNTGMRSDMGRTAVLDTGAFQFVVTERHQEPWDLGVFRSVGIEPTAKRYLILKSRVHYRAAFMPIARHVVDCDGVGVTSSDFGLFKFEKLRRPIFPLDDI